MASSHYMISDQFALTLEILNFTFTVIFAIEAIIKITALKKAYFKDNWNLFDFSIVVLAILIFVPTSLGLFGDF